MLHGILFVPALVATVLNLSGGHRRHGVLAEVYDFAITSLLLHFWIVNFLYAFELMEHLCDPVPSYFDPCAFTVAMARFLRPLVA